MDRTAKALGVQCERLFERLFAPPTVLRLLLVFLAVIPFHTFLANWLASNAGHELLIKSWKEIYLIGAGGVMAMLLWRHPKERSLIFNDVLIRLLIVYALLHVVLAFATGVEVHQALIGSAFNLRYLAVFATVYGLRHIWRGNRARRMTTSLYRVVVVAGGVVLVFAALQLLVLPDDFLLHFGYSGEIGRPYTTIDNNPDFLRFSSTLRGPNALGAYGMVLGLVSLGVLRTKQHVLKKAAFVVLLALPSALVAAQSRSAMVGLLVGLGVFGVLQLLHQRPRWMGARTILIGGVTGLVAIALLLTAARESRLLSVYVFHDDTADQIARTADGDRWEAYGDALNSIAEKPLGHGPGTNGPASEYGPQRAIAENYYLQIAYEVGIFGLAIFLAIVWLVLRRLYSAFWASREPIIAAILGATVGYLAINLFLHGWADDAGPMVLWALIGVSLLPKIKQQKPSHSE